ncbi:MAG: uL15 family ribosomal protein, partial [Patescibacteria group bacterium]|nr:uL15 family ribosomal protein [Patescibacteria group bacterium]
MQLHQLKLKHPKKLRKRVGRGGKSGTYSGKGMKGQKSRAGKKPRVDFAGGDTSMTKRIPKRRGTTGRHKETKVKRGVKSSILTAQSITIDLKDIEKKFKEGEVVSPKSLLEKGLIGRIRKSIPKKIKIIGGSKFTKGLKFKGVRLTKKLQGKD